MYRHRVDAGRQLAEKLKDRPLHEPLVLAIPRGGLIIGEVLARELYADLDVLLARKLRAPGQSELAIGAISEDGRVYVNTCAAKLGVGPRSDYLKEECRFQLAEIERRKQAFRAARPPAAIKGRSVIVTDDGIATGATMIAALDVIRKQEPHELIVAVPVGSADRLDEVRQHCGLVICPLVPDRFWAIGEFYQDFRQVGEDEAVAVLERCRPISPSNEEKLAS